MLLFKILGSILALTGHSFAAFESNGFELVYTAPVETKLEAPDLRNPVDVWVEMIDAATKTLDIEQMYAISKAGEPLEPVMQAIENAGKRGVKVRMLVEQKMMRASAPETLLKLQLMTNVELRILDFSKMGTDGIQHSKFFIVDGKSAYLGSQNFDWRSLKHIHETGLKFSNAKIVGPMKAIFESDWKAAGPKFKRITSLPKAAASRVPGDDELAYLVASPPSALPKGVAQSQAELTRLVDKAEKEIRIQLLDYSAAYRDKKYYAPIDNALRAAAARGVKVKLMVSHWNQEKPGIDYLKSLSMLPNIEIRIATIPLAKEGKIPFARVIHSKTMVIDDKIAWVGTSNWSGGYLDRLRSLEIVLKDTKMAARVAQLHEQLWSSEYAAKIEPAKEYPKPDKGAE